MEWDDLEEVVDLRWIVGQIWVDCGGKGKWVLVRVMQVGIGGGIIMGWADE